MPSKQNDYKKFQDIIIGETFHSGFAHMIEKGKDLFPDRPWDVFIKTGENKAFWLRGGYEREFIPSQSFIVQKVKITEER